jgi:phenol 2-monooxygenase
MMARKPEEFASPTELVDFYVRPAEFPAGFMTQYAPSLLVGEPTHQDLATGFPIGKRFKSAPVERVCDGNPVHLGHAHHADGRWRIYVFADAAPAGESATLAEWSTWFVEASDSPLRVHTPEGADAESVFDVKVVHQQPHLEVDLMRVPAAFLPRTGPFDLIDLEQVFATDPEHDVFEARGIDRGGAVVVVRPDQYVAQVLPLTATDELGAFFRQHLLPQAAATEPAEVEQPELQRS